ncbi:DPP IV N-terminal domain-containing protein, partial [candidate division KSB1 bacterium]
EVCMKSPSFIKCIVLALCLVFVFSTVFAQGKQEDYDRANQLREKVSGLVYNSEVRPNWIGDSNEFWYANTIKEGTEFIKVDPDNKSKEHAFDHNKLAESLSKATGDQYSAFKLPFNRFEFAEDERSIKFNLEENVWTCDLNSYECKDTGEEVQRAPQRGGRGQGSGRGSGGRGREYASPDGIWTASIRDYNIYLRSSGSNQERPLTSDGTEETYYNSIFWSPDSKKLVSNLTQRGKESTVYLIDSAPDDRMRPTMRERSYALPGDTLTIGKPVLFHVESGRSFKVDDTLFKNPYRVSSIRWNEDNSQFTLSFQQRGEQLARIIKVDAQTGEPSVVIEEAAETFVDRYNLVMEYFNGGDEILWGSERDGWKHLYLYDGKGGGLKNRVTQGEWVVRDIISIDEEKRQVIFTASGMNSGQDPYQIQYYRVNLDGTGLTELTKGNGNHRITFSPGGEFYLDIYSRIDLPPVSELRRTSDGELVMELEKADISDLLETGWKMPEPFVTKARDGETDIWGVIYRPTNFDGSKIYPVIEKIYAGPHDSFVPKTFSAYRSDQALAEIGFIVVQIDGMGTANRSKAFHDVCWQNLADAGFPDRIIWMKEAAQRYSYMDITRVGIFGHSAGGQNSLGALLFHPEFYKVAVSSCGCHDNRMDKAVWNEQWMGWPVGSHYEEQSNVTNAHKLEGKVLLVLGELDTNVPPQSTLQVVDALIRAEKDFEFLMLPGQGHSSGGSYGERKKRDYFVKHLLGVEPPNRNN